MIPPAGNVFVKYCSVLSRGRHSIGASVWETIAGFSRENFAGTMQCGKH
jgi:hypothetical protein